MYRLVLALIALSFSMQAQVHVTWLWHLQQPIYWPEQSASDPYHWQAVQESDYLKFSGGNLYSDGIPHPTNDLFDIFSKDDRKAVYQYRAKDAVQSLLGYPEAGAQVNYSGCLIENVNSLADANQWGYFPGWEGNFVTARGWNTSGGFPRMDLTGFTYHHALSPLVGEEVLRKQIQAHKQIYGETFGSSPVYSKGYWPAECSFSERIIPVLVSEGFEWSIVANSHIARTLADYPLSFGTNGTNYDPPNAADITPLSGNNWWSGQEDGRGGTFAAPMCYQPHKARYVDPATGLESKITVVPMADLLSYRDGFAPMSTTEISANIAPYEDPSRPSLVLLAHDGDNAYGGGYSYYLEATPNFAAAAAGAGYVPTSIQQYLNDHPVPSTDVVHVEDGSWVNAANDWGHPQFINWLWPLYTPAHEFDPNGWTEDYRNWAVLTAAENHVRMAEDIETAAGSPVDIYDIVHPGPSASNAELAWHFLMPGYTSGYMYYGAAEDMEVKPTLAANNALVWADQAIAAAPGTDNTPPSIFIPQRYPYNPGGTGFGPNYGYSTFNNPSDFHVWTLGYDVSGMASVVLRYREDLDGSNPMSSDQNEVYAGGPEVGPWQGIPMTQQSIPVGNITSNPEINFFLLPDQIADLYYGQIAGLSETLVDYYVEATDSAGNVYMSPIQHVYVGASTPVSGGPGGSYSVDWTPVSPDASDFITITVSDAGQPANLHWGVTEAGVEFTEPLAAYQPAGTVDWPGSGAVETPFSGPDTAGNLTLVLGPFDDPAQVAQRIDFVIHFQDDSWDNNGGGDYHINLSGVTGPPVGVSWTPAAPTSNDPITITVGGTAVGANLHWGVTESGAEFTTPIPAYRPTGSVLFGGTGPAVETPMSGDGAGSISVTVGPFDDPSQGADAVDFVIHYNDDSWDNNGGADYKIPITPGVPGCPVPANTQSNVFGPSTAFLVWDEITEATSYTLQGRRVGSSPKTVHLTNPDFYISSLLAGSDYQWRVRANCGAESSDYTEIQSFSTPALRAEADLRWSVWPVPADDQLNLSWRGEAREDLRVSLFSADGRQLQEHLIPASGTINLHVSELPAGLYGIRLSGPKGTLLSRTVVIQ